MFKKYLAFTMAEAMLVLMILGVIATMAITAMKPAENKEKALKVKATKVLKDIENATTQVILNDSYNGTLKGLYKLNSKTTFNTGSKDLTDLYKKYLANTRKISQAYGNLDNVIVLKDNTAIKFTYANITINCVFPNQSKTINTSSNLGAIEFDINDGEGPNQLGIDRYAIPIYARGINYNPESQEKNNQT